MRMTIIFLICFVVGATVALIGRTAIHHPYAEGEEHSATTGDGHVHEPPMPGMPGMPMKTGASSAASQPPAAATSSPMPEQHAVMPMAPTEAPASTGKSVNAICAVCGMPVDPDIPTAMYHGNSIGFGCSLCPPKFAKEPDKYGPSALRNEKTR